MSHYKEMLERTELKYLGIYLFDGVLPGEYTRTHDETKEQMLAVLEEELKQTMEGIEQNRALEIISAAKVLGSTYERVGYYYGLKAGARLVLHLLSDADVTF